MLDQNYFFTSFPDLSAIAIISTSESMPGWVSQNVLKSDLKESRSCPIWGPTLPTLGAKSGILAVLKSCSGNEEWLYTCTLMGLFFCAYSLSQIRVCHIALSDTQFYKNDAWCGHVAFDLERRELWNFWLHYGRETCIISYTTFNIEYVFVTLWLYDSISCVTM